MSSQARFIDLSGATPRTQQLWPSIVVPRKAIEDEITRLCDSILPLSGIRAAAIAHPLADSRIPSFTPGIDVTLHVVMPGETTPPVVRNSTPVDMCIGGSGVATIGDRAFAAGQFDVWNTPAMEPYSYRNEGETPFVRLSYSNAPLLEKLEVHYLDTQPGTRRVVEAGAAAGPRARDLAEVIDLGRDGAQLLGYEYLIDIDVVPSKALLWPWKEVAPHLEKVYVRDRNYTGRHLYALYNPATERRIGATHSFFATLAKYPPGKVDRAHRHSSAAINYYFMGHGRSIVNGEAMQWEAGDLHLSAPGWAVHHHASREQGFCALTIQDHPLQIAMESLIWQETMDLPIIKLGSQNGFETNLGQLVAT